MVKYERFNREYFSHKNILRNGYKRIESENEKIRESNCNNEGWNNWFLEIPQIYYEVHLTREWILVDVS